MRSRSGKLGVFGSVILMMSIVLFVGCMFWLLTEASGISGDTSTLFTPTTTEENTPKTLNQTIASLQSSGTIVTKYTKPYKDGFVNATHEALLSEASNTRLVYRVKDFKGTEVLIVETSNMVIQWYPEG